MPHFRERLISCCLATTIDTAYGLDASNALGSDAKTASSSCDKATPISERNRYESFNTDDKTRTWVREKAHHLHVPGLITAVNRRPDLVSMQARDAQSVIIQ